MQTASAARRIVAVAWLVAAFTAGCAGAGASAPSAATSYSFGTNHDTCHQSACVLHLPRGHMLTPMTARLYLALSVSDDWILGGADFAGPHRATVTYTLLDPRDGTTAIAECDNSAGRAMAPPNTDQLSADQAVPIFNQVCTLRWEG
jgi:hypothetical protein